MVVGAYRPKGYSVEAFSLYALLHLFFGVYLVFFPKKIIGIILNDKFIEETDEITKTTNFINIAFISLKIFGVYLFYKFMYCLVTAFNLAAGNWTPGNTEASAFVIQAIFHLGASMFLIHKTKMIIEIVFKENDLI